MAVIRRDFLPEDLQPILEQNGFSGCVVVQSEESEAENAFQLQNADKYSFIKGVVGWVDITAPDLEDQLSDLRQFKKLKGFRTILQGASPPNLMLQPAFLNGIGKLRQHNFTYDILIYPNQLKYIPKFVAANPDQPFVLDHLAKPDIKNNALETWTREIKDLAKFEQVYLKISGMVTEANWYNWQKIDFKPYLDVVVNAFGPNRIMFGSDWPVCLVAGTYEEVLGIVEDYFKEFSTTEQTLFFGGNAGRFYNLT